MKTINLDSADLRILADFVDEHWADFTDHVVQHAFGADDDDETAERIYQALDNAAE